MRNPGSTKRAAALTLVALFVLSGVLRAHAQRPHDYKSPARPAELSKTGLAANCELDTDVRQDRVTLQSNGFDKTIRIRFGNARRSQIAFTAPVDGSGSLITGDIDRDGDVDLIWVGKADRQSAVVLLNDGEGNFAEASDNTAFASALDDLFSDDDPSGKHSLKRSHKNSVLGSASFHELGMPVVSRLQSAAATLAQVSIHEPLKVSTRFVKYLRKRGPPPTLS